MKKTTKNFLNKLGISYVLKERCKWINFDHQLHQNCNIKTALFLFPFQLYIVNKLIFYFFVNYKLVFDLRKNTEEGSTPYFWTIFQHKTYKCSKWEANNDLIIILLCIYFNIIHDFQSLILRIDFEYRCLILERISTKESLKA